MARGRSARVPTAPRASCRRSRPATGTIGYADASAVGDLGKVSLGVGSEFVAPTADAAAKTVDVSPRDDTRADGDIVIKVDRTTTESGAYPAILVSYLVVCNTYDTPGQGRPDQGLRDLRHQRRRSVERRHGGRLRADLGRAPHGRPVASIDAITVK